MSEDLKIYTEYELVTISAEAPLPVSNIDEYKWIAAAREGQVIALKDGLGTITREGLESSIGTWDGKDIIDDHKTVKKGFSIHGEKFVSPFLYFLLDPVTVGDLKKGAGGSIDALASKIKDNRVLGMSGVGYSILPSGQTPSCTKDAGCGTEIAGATDNVNISREDRKIIGGIDKLNLKQKIKSEIKNKGGNKKKMVDNKEETPEVTFSAKQVAEIKAAAVAEVTEQLGNAHKVTVGDMETAKAAELKTLTDTHTTELETQRDAVYKQAAMVEGLATQYSLSEEAKKALSDAKTLEDALVLFAGLKITKPIAGKGAAEGDKADKGGGVIEGAGKIEAKAPETVKVEEIGDFNPYTKKYEPTFREELK
jgi:hypothetical protein